MITKVKYIAFFLTLLLLHYLFGWLVPLIFSLLTAGFVLDKFIIVSISIFGFTINALPLLFNYFLFKESAQKVSQDLSIIFGDIDALIILLISIIIPTLMYSLAGIVAWQVNVIKTKLTA